MRNLIIYHLLFTIILTLIVSCTPMEKGCDASYEMYTHSVNMPDSIAYGSKAELTIKYFPFSHCSKFGGFNDTQIGDTIYIGISGYEDECLCEQIPDTIATYSFSGYAKREYIFRFNYPGDSIIQDTLKVY